MKSIFEDFRQPYKNMTEKERSPNRIANDERENRTAMGLFEGKVHSCSHNIVFLIILVILVIIESPRDKKTSQPT